MVLVRSTRGKRGRTRPAAGRSQKVVAAGAAERDASAALPGLGYSPSLAFFFLPSVPPSFPRKDSSFLIRWGRRVGERTGEDIAAGARSGSAPGYMDRRAREAWNARRRAWRPLPGRRRRPVNGQARLNAGKPPQDRAVRLPSQRPATARKSAGGEGEGSRGRSSGWGWGAGLRGQTPPGDPAGNGAQTPDRPSAPGACGCSC